MSSTIHISGLHSTTKKEDLEIRFSKFGKIQTNHLSKVGLKGNNKREAFIKYYKVRDAKLARSKMNNVYPSCATCAFTALCAQLVAVPL